LKDISFHNNLLGNELEEVKQWALEFLCPSTVDSFFCPVPFCIAIMEREDKDPSKDPKKFSEEETTR
jgi:hypothetical protein